MNPTECKTNPVSCLNWLVPLNPSYHYMPDEPIRKPSSEAFGRALRAARLSAGFSQQSLSLEGAMRRGFLSDLERGNKEPTLSTLLRLASGLGVPAGRLVAMAEQELVSMAEQAP